MTADEAGKTAQPRPAQVIAAALRLRMDDDMAGDITADIIFSLRIEGYRLVSSELRPELERGPVEIVARSLVEHTRIAPIAARGAAGWCLAELHGAGWRVSRVDDPPDPDPPIAA